MTAHHRNQFNGEGKLTLASGDVLKGTFGAGRLNGFGVLTQPSGFRYEGTFAHGKFDGQGSVTYPDGSSTCSFNTAAAMCSPHSM